MTPGKSFERSFIATRYLLGCRSDLTSGLENPTDEARRFAEALLVPDRAARARGLAAALLPMTVALDARRLK